MQQKWCSVVNHACNTNCGQAIHVSRAKRESPRRWTPYFARLSNMGFRILSGKVGIHPKLTYSILTHLTYSRIHLYWLKCPLCPGPLLAQYGHITPWVSFNTTYTSKVTEIHTLPVFCSTLTKLGCTPHWCSFSAVLVYTSCAPALCKWSVCTKHTPKNLSQNVAHTKSTPHDVSSQIDCTKTTPQNMMMYAIGE